MAFKITLAPPAALITTPAAADATDVVGNLGADGAGTWALPMAEGHARSSIHPSACRSLCGSCDGGRR